MASQIGHDHGVDLTPTLYGGRQPGDPSHALSRMRHACPSNREAQTRVDGTCSAIYSQPPAEFVDLTHVRDVLVTLSEHNWKAFHRDAYYCTPISPYHVHRRADNATNADIACNL